MNAPVITTTKVELREIAERIRSRTAQALIENGRDLLKAKVALPHGKFIAWLKHDVQITPRSAQRAMQVGDYDWQGQQIEENTRRVLERLVGPLDWTRLAITEAQVQERDLPRIQKPDRRYKPVRYHDAVETEALGQTVIVKIFRDSLDALLPDPLKDVLEREERQRQPLRKLLKGAAQ